MKVRWRIVFAPAGAVATVLTRCARGARNRAKYRSMCWAMCNAMLEDVLKTRAFATIRDGATGKTDVPVSRWLNV